MGVVITKARCHGTDRAGYVVEYKIYPESRVWSVAYRRDTKKEAEILLARIHLGLDSMFRYNRST